MIQLVNDRVAVTPIFDADTSKGGIIIPDMAKERCDQGIVKYIGPEVKDIKIGQYVLFSGYTGTLVHVEGEGSIIIMPEEFIVAVLSDVENVFVPGLYYKSKVDKEKQRQELIDIVDRSMKLFDNFGNRYRVNVVDDIVDELIKCGAYGMQASPYYQADYENILNFVADAFKDKQFDVKVPKPTWDKDGQKTA